MTQDEDSQEVASGELASHEVVIDREERYSLWPSDRTVPAGWTATGFRGPRQACLGHVGTVWLDQRPLSLREAGHERH